jgi:hypothetical protein
MPGGLRLSRSGGCEEALLVRSLWLWTRVRLNTVDPTTASSFRASGHAGDWTEIEDGAWFVFIIVVVLDTTRIG